MRREESPAEELTIKILYVEWVFLNVDATGVRRASYS
jgi:hypothetical protein